MLEELRIEKEEIKKAKLEEKENKKIEEEERQMKLDEAPKKIQIHKKVPEKIKNFMEKKEENMNNGLQPIVQEEQDEKINQTFEKWETPPLDLLDDK
jgi:hypothetical protein